MAGRLNFPKPAFSPAFGSCQCFAVSSCGMESSCVRAVFVARTITIFSGASSAGGGAVDFGEAQDAEEKT